MPDAGASRKRQIQVTPGPFNDAAASGAGAHADRAGLRGFLADFAILNAAESARRVERGFNRAVPGQFSAVVDALKRWRGSATARLRFDLAGEGTIRSQEDRSSFRDTGSPPCPRPRQCILSPENKGFCNYWWVCRTLPRLRQCRRATRRLASL